ncbi:hypothetical protein I7G86_09975 [Sinorhizobium meliloti]|uniref:Uncharacterized protein n=1 Tax=Sinorhizobium meliloti (strain SM11) TaxID=707241 RepID=F7X9F9_SINMM|nr:hypothetical protein [Sinorhizobium meliloti]PST25592.1 hypothetical protein C7U62_13120 [Mesorhizobium loti]AEH79067.1 hypothetical protein SM11_chr1799 [Sinorhizobium meliloti SM11]MDE3766223.1 hypothetical protein [Sinorhizobium meliloti]MDE3781152.1 hypothetical protein [Sinorhizobium meliloti]MDE3784252.1 hypothetical protein [Sinorhizobium meliloti]
MLSSKALKELVAEARPIIERQLDDAEMIAGFRDVVSAAGGDWSALKALIKAQIQDERDETGNGKRVKKILEKADFSTGYADLLGWSNMNEKNFSAEERIDPLTGEILDDAPVTIIDRTDDDGHRLAVTVDPEIAAILACRREQERSDGGLNIITKHTEIATSAGGESEEVAKNAVASASGPDEKRAPLFAAKPPSTRRPHCLDRAGCGSYTEEHCAPCKAAMQECEHAEEVA